MGEPEGRRGLSRMKTAPWLLVASGALEKGRIVVLDAAEARHVTGALRRRPGDEIVLADGNGSVAEAKLVAIGRGRAEAEVLSVRQEAEPESKGVTVALAMVECRVMDWAVQKAVEVGVRRFVPIETGRAQVRGGDRGGRIEHLRKISMQALKQCRRAWAMDVEDVTSLTLLVESETGIGVSADREGNTISDLPKKAGGLLIVGPEGGFTAEESELFDHLGWPRLRLGPHILRAETAAVVGGAMMVARDESR
jgi:16S rRNA (uracil1498-N3)-methyltransferase